MEKTCSMKNMIKSDCYRYYGKDDFKSRLYVHYIQAAFKYTCQYRKVHEYIKKEKKGIKYFYHRWRLLRLSIKYGYQINAEADIGPGFYMGHRGTVIINGASSIGANVNVMPGVNIGQENRGKRQGVPVIGNKVWIGTNAVIVGKIRIGNNVLIAPNAYVNFDVPSNSIVIGNPARIIHNEKATEGYIQYPYEE